MSNLYDDFEKRFENVRFSSSWSEVEVRPQVLQNKDIEVLQQELEEINLHIESVKEKQLRLANLAKFYTQGEFLTSN